MATVTRATVPLRGKMKKVIRNEAKALSLIAGRLASAENQIKWSDDKTGDVVVCKGPGHCAMGALMFAAGISNKRIRDFENDGDADYDRGLIARKLFDTYHIDSADARSIINSNDRDDSVSDDVEGFKGSMQDRAKRVLSCIDSLPKRERLRPPARV